MTDNRTTELREKLTEHGVDYEVKDLPDINFFHDTRWNANGVRWCFTEFVGATTCLTMCNEWKDCTPEQAIAATLGSDKPPYDELLRCLENDWHISASWDGLRKFWCVELTEEGVRMRDAHDEALRRIAALEELVWFMVPFFVSACSHECGCPDGYFEPHGCDDGCKALKELNDRMVELGLEVGE